MIIECFKLENISEQEYKMFNEQLNSKYELYVQGNKYLPSKEQIETLGVKLYPKKKAKKVTEIKNVDENEFYFYSKTKKAIVFNFWKHLRNCSSHNNRIKILKTDSEKYYFFEDKWRSDRTMKGVINVNNWDNFIKSLIEKSIKN